MARTRQTARKSTGGKAPRKQIASKAARKQNYLDEDDEDEDVQKVAPSKVRLSFVLPAAGHAPHINSLPNPIGFPDEDDDQTEEEPHYEYDVSYESSFYAHYFEAGHEEKKTLAPRYALARCADPTTAEQEFWLSLNFNSKLDGNGILKNGRPTLNLVVGLDVSGSMSHSFDSGEGGRNSKLKVAKEALLAILAQLKDEDSFGFFVFNNAATVIQPLTRWKDTDRIKLEKDIMRLRAGGDTELTRALKAGGEMFDKAVEGTNCSSRVFFLTDMDANYQKDGADFADLVGKHSTESIWTTVIGVGLDLTSNIIEKVSKTPGCNYSNVRTSDDFKLFMDNEFPYIVAPIGFNINVSLVSDDVRLEKGYGTPEVNSMKPGDSPVISTEFPCVQNDRGEKRPGPLLFRLKALKDAVPLQFKMKVTWEDLQGIENRDEQTFEFTAESTYQDNGIRKQILLVCYTALMKEVLEQRKFRIEAPEKVNRDRDFHTDLAALAKHFEAEKAVIGDDTLQQELDILKEIIDLEATYRAKQLSLDGSKDGKAEVAAPILGKRKVDEIAPEVVMPEVAPQPEVAADPKQARVAEANEEQECVVCLTDKKNVVFMPCKHVACCGGCSPKVTECPLCRENIEARINVFM